MLRITAKSIIDEFDARGITYQIVNETRSIVRYKIGDTWRFLRSSLTEFASPVGVSIADNKHLTREIIKLLDIQAPAEVAVKSIDNAQELLSAHDEIVIKPCDAAHGNGVSTGITSAKHLAKAVDYAREASPSGDVIAQEMVYGQDIRILIIGGSYAAACERVPACVNGDGSSTVEELIFEENDTNPLRGDNYTNALNKIDMSAAKQFSGAKLHETPRKNEEVQVVGTANLGTGGMSRDITDLIPQAIIEQAESISKFVGLPICGVDYIAEDIADAKTYNLIELNACPSFGLHLYPTTGKQQPVDILFVDYLMEQV